MIIRRVLAVAMIAICLAAPPALAVIPVIDASNLVQNALTAARTLQEINNQILQLQNEAKMLINEALNLTSLPFNIVGQLRATLASTTALINQAQGVAFQLQQAQAVLTRFYPMSYAGTSGDAMASDAMMRWAFSHEALQTTVLMQAQSAQNLASDEDSLATLVSHSQNAVGILEAAQATNQLLALQSRQLIQGQQLALTQSRSAALEAARNVTAEERAREVRRRFLGTTTQYSPQPINLYGY